VLEECPKPIIAAVHGKCVGGGLDIIAACDIRLCTEDATFSLREAGIGLVADMGILQRLPLIIGQGFTREMAYTARFFSAKEVARMGMVNGICVNREALMDEAKKLAALISENAPLAVQQTKKVLNYSRSATVEDGMSMAMQKNMVLLFSQDVREAMFVSTCRIISLIRCNSRNVITVYRIFSSWPEYPPFPWINVTPLPTLSRTSREISRHLGEIIKRAFL